MSSPKIVLPYRPINSVFPDPSGCPGSEPAEQSAGRGTSDIIKTTMRVTEAPNAVQAAAQADPRQVSYRDVRNNEKIRAYIAKANEQMAVIGYSEHGLRHAGLVAAIARNILLELGEEQRKTELAAIAGFLHDIGNCVHRIYHPQIGATMAFQLLDQMGMEASEVATIIGAIGNHEEPEGVPNQRRDRGGTHCRQIRRSFHTCSESRPGYL